MLKAKLAPYGYNYSTDGLTLGEKIEDIIAYYSGTLGRTLMRLDEEISPEHTRAGSNDLKMVRLSLYGIKQDGFYHDSIKLKEITREALDRAYFNK